MKIWKEIHQNVKSGEVWTLALDAIQSMLTVEKLESAGEPGIGGAHL